MKNEVADKIVGPIGSTNLTIVFTGYVTFWIYADFILATYLANPRGDMMFAGALGIV